MSSEPNNQRISHTQGQWDSCTSMSSDFRAIRYISDQDANIIAEVRYVEGFSQEEMLANAKLIAAAPELLATLKLLMLSVAGCEREPRYEAARAAIKRAEA